MSKNTNLWLGAVVLAGAAGGLGNWWGARHAGLPQQSEPAAHAGVSATAASQPVERKIRFYRNPMGLPDTSPTPKKDSMGMDYIPVYEGEDEAPAGAPSALKFSADKVQKMGVRTEAVALRALDKVVRASARVEPDERRISSIAPRFEGYIEKLHVNATGQAVAKGQPLLEYYAPELLAAQREYLIAMQGVKAMEQAGAEAQRNMQMLAEASLARLRNWDVSEEQLRELTSSGTPKRTLTLRSPVSGFVAEKKAVQGMRFMPGDALYQISDLSSVWLLADVAEQDIAAVRTGARARVQIHAYPGKALDALVSFVYPTLNAETRTVPVRLEMANPGGLLKPGMFAQVDLPVGSKARVLTVPLSAVIDSGSKQLVLVQLGDAAEGRFEPRAVTLGARGDSYLEVQSGLREGDQVVVSANFLIDAESNLKAAIAGFGAPAGGPAAGASAAGGTSGSMDKPAAAVGHQAQGKVVEVDAKALSVTISHGPVASLKWPAMTMDFVLSNRAMLKDLKPQVAIAFDFVERGKGEWVITRVAPQGASPAAGPAAHPAK